MVKADKLILGATIIFIVGLITSSVAIKAYQTLLTVQRNSGLTIDESRARSIITILSLLPWAFGVMYSLVIAYVIYYVLKGEK